MKIYYIAIGFLLFTWLLKKTLDKRRKKGVIVVVCPPLLHYPKEFFEKGRHL